MRLTIQLKLLPTAEQADALRRTLVRANEACDSISRVAWEAKTFRQFAVHRLTYHAVRATFGLSAQLTVRCIAKVADAYKLDQQRQRTFFPLGAVAYDERILYYRSTSVSIWTLDGRHAIPFVCGERQQALLAFRTGESDLAFVRGNWYLFATADVETPDPIDVAGVLGIDVGVSNIAVDSDGEIHAGTAIKHVRYRHRRLRNKLQRKGTKRSRYRLKSLAGQEAHFAKDVNHVRSKRIVAKAERTKRAIAVEDLTHMRTRIRARRSQRAPLHSWSFAQLQAYIAKALRAEVPVHRVDPRNMSRTCHPDTPQHPVHVFAMGPGGPAAELHVAVQPALPPAQPGAGGVHHVAFRIPDDAYDAWAERLNTLRVANSGKVDRYWFRSLYFREPNGILFELATEGPGFGVDEPEATLGEQVVLAPFLEPQRAAMVARLTPLD